jgi:hypothetical protein
MWIHVIPDNDVELSRMKLAIRILVLSASLGSWAALADEPQTPAAEPAVVQTSAPSTPSGEAAKPEPGAVAAPAKSATGEVVDVASTDALIKRMRARGYKPVNRNGILVFCRSEQELGTHFERSRCNTLDELKDAERTGKEYTNQIQQQGSPTEFKPDVAPNPHR